MSVDTTGIDDNFTTAAGYQRPGTDLLVYRGWLHIVLTGPTGEVKYEETVVNQITQIGEQMYGERGAGVASPPAVPTGMALGTGTTTVAKTGAGAALVTGVSGSAVALDNSTPTSALSSTIRRITYHATWAAGTATSNGLAEVVLQNGTATVVPTNAATTNIVSRALLSPTVNKGASDSLSITWNHDIGSP
jgi:hypothetical protein